MANNMEYAHFEALKNDQYGHKIAPEEMLGHFFREYNPATGEGRGWFGAPDYWCYGFRREVVNGALCESTIGDGAGCFWSDWEPF